MVAAAAVSPYEAAIELKARRNARRSMRAFATYTKPDYQANWHHNVLCDYLDRFVEGSVKRLLVFCPPRHGKSELVSRRLPAFILGCNPDARIIACSYSADLASRMNRDVQRIIDSPAYGRLFPDTRLFSANVRTVSRGTYLRNSDIFEVVGHNGGYRSAGVGGGITGMGFDYGIIDDPIKNRKEANSLTLREAIWDWYTSTFYTRQEKDAAILITVTRWHVDDLAGRLLMLADGRDGEQWTILDFPAVAEDERHPDDPREPGEALWPDKYNRAALDTIHAQIGDYDWSALYQQSPVLNTGGMFKRDKVAIIDDVPTDIVRTARFWDLALSAKTSADYTVGVKLGLTADNRIIVLDVARFQCEWDDVVNRIVPVAEADGPDCAIGVESAFYQTRAVTKLLEQPAMHRYSIRGIKPDADKVTRALPFQARWGAGLVAIMRRAWTQAFLDELCSFPLGAHDDIVDAAAGAYTMLDMRAAIEFVENPFFDQAEW